MKGYIHMTLGEKIAHLRSRGLDRETIQLRLGIEHGAFWSNYYRTPQAKRKAVEVNRVDAYPVDSSFREGHSYKDRIYA